MSTAERPRCSALEPLKQVDAVLVAHDADVADQVGVVPVDEQRILAQQAGGDDAVDVTLGRVRAVKSLAQPDQSLVGVDLHPEQVRELVDAQGFQGGDFHVASVGRVQEKLRSPYTWSRRFTGGQYLNARSAGSG